MWPSTKLLDLLGVTLPIISAPMAGLATVELAAAVPGAGGLGSLGASASTPEDLRRDITRFRAQQSAIVFPFQIDGNLTASPRMTVGGFVSCYPATTAKSALPVRQTG